MSPLHSELFRQFLIKHTPFAQAEAEILIPFLDEVSLEPNDYFLEVGSPVLQIAFLLTGILQRFTFDENGKKIIWHFISENHFFADFDGYYHRIASTSYVQAITPCRILVMPISEIDRLRRQYPEFHLIMYQLSERHLIERMESERFLREGSLLNQYKHFITHFPHLDQHVQLQDVASYLRVIPSSLSRIRKKIK